MSEFRQFTNRFAKPLWRWYLGGIFALAITNLITLEIPQLCKSVVNLISRGEAPTDSASLALTIIGLGLAQIIVRGLSRVLIFWPGRELEAVSRTDMFQRAMHFTYQFFLRFGMGDLISRLSNDLGQLRIFYAFGVLQALNLVFLSIFTLGKMIAVHLGLTIAALIPMSLMLAVTRIVWPSMQRQSRLSQDALGRLTNKITEAFVNVHSIQANAAQDTFVARVDTESNEVYRTNMRVIFIRTLFFPLMTCMAGIAQVLVLFYGSYEVLAARLSIGDILAFNIYLGYLAFPFSALGMLLAIYQRAATAIDRLKPFSEEQPQTTLPPIKVAKHGNGTAGPVLKISDLSFNFPRAAATDTAPFGLKSINLEIYPGEQVGFFGPVGSGKTTLFNLLTRIVEVPQGSIFLGGQDITEIEPQMLRRQIAYGLQVVHLFSDTIRNNLCFGLTPLPTDKQLTQALIHAAIAEEISSFPSGLETEIGERGVRLSGGQKQRLALARLFLRRPQILVLDDVLAAVDKQTERRIMHYIHSTGSALIMASHRPSTLKAMNKIVMIDKGTILRVGSYAELSLSYPELREEPLGEA